MSQFIITPTLYSNWYWYNRLDGKTKEDFLNTLNKVKEPPTDAMLAGINFEDAVHADCVDGLPGEVDGTDLYARCVRKVAETVNGGLWQQPCGKEITIGGVDYILYGKIDVLKRDWIFDIKFTGSYEVGKYTDSVQHDLYMFCTGIHKFAYLPSDGKDTWREDYFFTPEAKQRMVGNLATMMEGIYCDDDFNSAYCTNWQAQQHHKEAA